jgi:hypothetical protein
LDDPTTATASSTDTANESMVIGLGWKEVKQARFISLP